jgi:hypothetical protein
MIRLEVLLHEMNWKEAKQYFAENDLAILPVGLSEQRVPHLTPSISVACHLKRKNRSTSNSIDFK